MDRDLGQVIEQVSDVLVAGVAAQLVRRGRSHDPAALHDGHAIAEAEGFEEVVGYQQERLAQRLLEVEEVVLQLASRERVESAEGLVEEHDRGIGGDGAGEGDALTLSAGEHHAALADDRVVALGEVLDVGGVQVDRWEARGVAAALGERSAELPVTAIKGALGESLGASGALQTVVLLEAMAAGELPGITGLDEIEPDLPLPLAGPDIRRGSFRCGLITSLSWDGHAWALVVEAE